MTFDDHDGPDLRGGPSGDALLRHAVDSGFNGVVVTDALAGDDPIVYVNPAFERITGYPAEEVLGRNARLLQNGDSDQAGLHELRDALEAETEWSGVFRNYKKDGTPFWQEHNVSPVRDEEGRITHHVGIINDITERKALEDELVHRAFHDGLTGLPNRALLEDRLGQALARTRRRSKGEAGALAVLFMDLDNFKYVNDSLGHRAGDELLVEVAARLRAALRPEDTLARLGGDEFVVLVERIEDEESAGLVAERIAEALREPVVVGGQEVFATASVGVALGRDGAAPEDLLRDADTAMYRAKEGGKARSAVFRRGMGEASSARLRLEGELRRALERGEFRVFYQPKALLETGEIVGAEALLRWEHPERGLLAPWEFVPLAEETGLLVPIGRWVLEEACRQARKWREELPPGAVSTMCVNLSAHQLKDPALVGHVRGALEGSGLEPSGLVLEITEGVLMENAFFTLATLRDLKGLGVGLAIDDFGTGYSSLSYLKRFPIDYVKIDRSIVSGVERDAGNEAIVTATVVVARAMGFRVVAEGVETAEEAEKLRSLGCDLGQGYYWWRPNPAREAAKLLGATRRTPPSG